MAKILDWRKGELPWEKELQLSCHFLTHLCDGAEKGFNDYSPLVVSLDLTLVVPKLQWVLRLSDRLDPCVS